MSNNTITKRNVKEKLSFTDVFKEFFPDHYQKSGNSYCPFHNDNNPSLQINLNDKDAYCHACVEPFDIFSLYKQKHNVGFKEALKGLGQMAGIEFGKEKTRLGRIIATYDYTDEKGEMLFQVCRHDPKDFRQRKPDGKGGWINSLGDVWRVLYRLPEVSKADQVFIVEGEKDADNLSEIGFCGTTNAGGSQKWKNQDEKWSISQQLKGKDIVIIPDNDEPGRKHAEQVAQNLHGRAKSIKLVSLPGLKEKGDVSDYIEMHGKEKAKDDILKLAEEAPEWEPGTEKAIDVLVENGFRPDHYAETILLDHHVIFHHDAFYLYQNGVYKPWDPWEVKGLIKSMGKGRLKRAQYEDVIHSLKVATYVDSGNVDRAGLLNLKNGVIDINAQNVDLMPHNPDIHSTIQLPITFKDDARCDQFLKFLKDKAPDNELQDLIKEVFGYCLTPSARFQKAFIFYGGTGTGKSTLLHILGSLIGRDNTTAIPLDQLGKRFQTAQIDGKLVNLSSEISVKEFVNDGVIKAIIAGDEITGERKHKDSYRFRPYCRLVIACNDLPLSKDTSNAFFRRFTLIPFNVPLSPEKYDLDLPDKIVEQELDGIFVWALAGLHNLRKVGRFTQPKVSKDAMDEWKRDADPVREFAHEFLKEDSRSRGVYLSTLQGRFNGWCKATSRKTEMTSKTLKKRMEGAGFSFTRSEAGNILRGFSLSNPEA